MVDVSGRPYTRLASAFLYRKTTVDNCKCKPNPWAQSEIDRHRLYALNETDAERRKRMGLPAFEIASADAAVGRVIGTAPVTAIGKAARLTLPSDPAVAARFASPSETKPADPAEQPAEFKATASSSGDDPAATPGPEKKPGLETAERPAALSGKRRAVAGSERRQAVAQPNVRRTSPAYAQKPAKSGFGGMFGLGAGAQKRWPGE